MAGAEFGNSPRRESWAGRLWAALALLTCPCYLPIWLLLLSGSTFGAVIRDHLYLTLQSLVVLFILSLLLALRAFGAIGRSP